VSDYAIRPAHHDDLEAIDRLVTPVTLAQRHILVPALERGEFLVADDDDEGVIGVVQVKDHVIKVLAVTKACRRHGIGRALVDACGSPVSLKCPSDLEANTFYQRLGFREESCSLTPRGRLLVHYIRP
jgi:N-acetylglutamate synthase-like GNAT family acetyltransferase